MNAPCVFVFGVFVICGVGREDLAVGGIHVGF